MQLKTVVIDASALASDVDLDTTLTQLSGKKYGRVTFIIANEGVASAYLETAEDIAAGVLSSVVIEAAKTQLAGPYEWPDSIPWLHSLIGAKCRVTPHWEE